MYYQCFTLNIEEKVAHLKLNRPHTLNTMQPVMWREHTSIMKTLQRDTARVLIISSTGKHFTGGMSLDVFGSDDSIWASGKPAISLKHSRPSSRATRRGSTIYRRIPLRMQSTH